MLEEFLLVRDFRLHLYLVFLEVGAGFSTHLSFYDAAPVAKQVSRSHQTNCDIHRRHTPLRGPPSAVLYKHAVAEADSSLSPISISLEVRQEHQHPQDVASNWYYLFIDLLQIGCSRRSDGRIAKN